MRKVDSVSRNVNIRRSMLVIAIGLFMVASPGFAMAKDVIGVVDVLKTFQSTDLGKSIQAHLSRFQKKRGDEVQGERKQLQEEQKQIEQQVGVISKDALKAKELAFQQKVQAYQKKLQKIQTQVASENAVEIRKFLDALTHASEALGKKYGFQIILSQHPIRIPMGPYPPPFQSSRIVYMNPKADLTQSVIQYINKHNSPGGTGE